MRWIPSIGKFNEIRREHDVFFLYATTNHDENDNLFNQYKDIVNRYLSQTYFYATNVSIIQQTYFSKYKTDAKSQIFAIKNEGFYLYKSEDYNNNLEQFIIKEKVATFPQVASGNIHDLIVTKKIVIIYAFKDQQENVAGKQKRFDFIIEKTIKNLYEFLFRNELKTQMRSYVTKHLSTLRDIFQFSWSNDLDLLSNIGKYRSFFLHYFIYYFSSCMDT